MQLGIVMALALSTMIPWVIQQIVEDFSKSRNKIAGKHKSSTTEQPKKYWGSTK